jgi:hypothetical protein
MYGNHGTMQHQWLEGVSLEYFRKMFGCTRGRVMSVAIKYGNWPIEKKMVSSCGRPKLLQVFFAIDAKDFQSFSIGEKNAEL